MKAYKAGRKGFTAAYIPFIAVFLIIIFFSQCNTTEPPEDDLQPGRRDYAWTVDTLIVPEERSIPSWMWGANANDIWAAGEIYLLVSLGQADSQAYGIAIWNGQNWVLKKLLYNNCIGSA